MPHLLHAEHVRTLNHIRASSDYGPQTEERPIEDQVRPVDLDKDARPQPLPSTSPKYEPWQRRITATVAEQGGRQSEQ